MNQIKPESLKYILIIIILYMYNQKAYKCKLFCLLHLNGKHILNKVTIHFRKLLKTFNFNKEYTFCIQIKIN